MKATFAIAKRDFKSFFSTPLGWIASCIIFLISGIVFFIIVKMLLLRGQSVDPVADIMGQIIGFLNYINIFIVPAFTMRSITEEFANGSYRLQSSAPISDWEIVLGKFFGIMFYFGTLGLLMLIYPLYTVIFSDPDLKVMLGGWLGFTLNIAAIVSIGIFVGSLTKNPIISYLGTAFSIILFIFSGYFNGVPAWYKESVNILELGNDFAKGEIKTGSLAIYFAIIFIFLSLSKFVFESKKWKV
ncbi:MAG: ABC transporter permease [Silvanigrellaceae bacterium]|nr:ABC transporter permease [Silvanigrellaceae bacterium]